MKWTAGVSFSEIFIKPTSHTGLQAFRALFVGGFSFIADAGLLFLLSLTGAHYLVCGLFGFIAGLFVNFYLSTKYVFTGEASVKKSGEIAVYTAVSAVGLALTEILLWLFTDVLGLHLLASKCVAALLVFAWSFVSRKYILYKERPK